MAEHTLIDRYVSELGREMKWTRNAEEILEEVVDHLLEAVAVHARRGLDLVAAQRHALAEFGDPQLVGRAFASTTTGGIAVPTTFTRRAGVALTTSSILWLSAIGLIYLSDVLSRTRPWEGLPQAVFLSGAVTLMAAGAMLTIGVLGLNRRHGGTLGLAGRFALWIAIVTALAGIASWAWGFWLTPLGVGAVVLAMALYRAEIAPATPSILVGIGGGGAAITAWWFQLTTPEVVLGEGAFTAAVFISLAAYSLGLSLLGGWLQSEEAVDQSDPLAIA